MKVKLYKKLVKIACKAVNVTKAQLFSGCYGPFVLYTYKYSFAAHKLKQDSGLVVVNGSDAASNMSLLYAIWNCKDIATEWLVKYWKHSHWKSYISIQLDLGRALEDIVKNIAKMRRVSI